MNYKTYLQDKESGNASLIKINGGYALSFKRYSEKTGELVKPEVRALSREELLEEKTRLESEIAGIDSVIADMDALDVTK
jgi:hypothetical protein